MAEMIMDFILAVETAGYHLQSQLLLPLEYTERRGGEEVRHDRPALWGLEVTFKEKIVDLMIFKWRNKIERFGA